MVNILGYKRESMVDVSEVLLFDILQELKELRKALDKPVKQTKEKGSKICQYCGKVHEKPVQYAICARRNKKEGVSNE